MTISVILWTALLLVLRRLGEAVLAFTDPRLRLLGALPPEEVVPEEEAPIDEEASGIDWDAVTLEHGDDGEPPDELLDIATFNAMLIDTERDPVILTAREIINAGGLELVSGNINEAPVKLKSAYDVWNAAADYRRGDYHFSSIKYGPLSPTYAWYASEAFTS